MSNLIESLFKEVPWLRSVVAWAIALLVVFLVLTIPAYYILWPFFERARTKLASSIDQFAKRVEENRSRRIERLNSAADEFLEDGGLRRLEYDNRKHWVALTSELAQPLKKLRKPTNKAARSLDKLSKSIPELQKHLQQSSIHKPQPLPELPKPEEWVESTGQLRVARVFFFVTLVALMALITVNTGMLSQILRDLGVIPATRTFIGIPLAYIFAFILTLVEASIGIVHAMAQNKNPDEFSIRPIIIVGMALIVAFVEGFFYSRIASGTSRFSIPVLNYEIPERHVFFFWGFALVIVLFILGFYAFESLTTVLQGSKNNTFQREIAKLRKRHERYVRVVKQSEEVLKKAKTAASDATQVLKEPGASGTSVQEQINEVMKKVEALKNVEPEWAKEKQIKLTRSEVHQLAQMGGLWLSLALLGLAVMTFTGLWCFRILLPVTTPKILWGMAIVQASLFFVVGLLLNAGETIIQEKESGRGVLVAPWFSRWLAYILGMLLLAAYIGVFFSAAKPQGLGIVWALNLLIGLFLIAIGYQLRPLLNVVHLWLQRLWNAIVLLLEVFWLMLMRIVHLGLVVLDNIAYLLALPVSQFIGVSSEEQKKIGKANI